MSQLKQKRSTRKEAPFETPETLNQLLSSDSNLNKPRKEDTSEETKLGKRAPLPTEDSSAPQSRPEKEPPLPADLSTKKKDQLSPSPAPSASQRARFDSPYLLTIKRQNLDFDHEKFCSVSMANKNIYCCLVCGKFFQGRGKDTLAYKHSLEAQHFLFINLENQKVYCLPENYEVLHPSLEDIKVALFELVQYPATIYQRRHQAN